MQRSKVLAGGAFLLAFLFLFLSVKLAVCGFNPRYCGGVASSFVAQVRAAITSDIPNEWVGRDRSDFTVTSKIDPVQAVQYIPPSDDH